MRTNYVSVNHWSVCKCNVSGLRTARSEERLCEDKEGAENFFCSLLPLRRKLLCCPCE